MCQSCDDALSLYGEIVDAVDREMYAAWSRQLDAAVLGGGTGEPLGWLNAPVRGADVEARIAAARPREVAPHPALVTRVVLCDRPAPRPPAPPVRRRDHTEHDDGSITLHCNGFWQFDVRTHPGMPPNMAALVSPDLDRIGRYRLDAFWLGPSGAR